MQFSKEQIEALMPLAAVLAGKSVDEASYTELSRAIAQLAAASKCDRGLTDEEITTDDIRPGAVFVKGDQKAFIVQVSASEGPEYAYVADFHFQHCFCEARLLAQHLRNTGWQK